MFQVSSLLFVGNGVVPKVSQREMKLWVSSFFDRDVYLELVSSSCVEIHFERWAKTPWTSLGIPKTMMKLQDLKFDLPMRNITQNLGLAYGRLAWPIHPSMTS